MRIAILNEVSARDKNNDILEALRNVGIDKNVYNAGMSAQSAANELTYIHTGLMAGLLLNLDAADLVIGGCGTGQGFLLSAMQYPSVFCGHITDPLEAWLFSQINGGNCVSLALNKAYGWAGKINLEYIFEKLFKDKSGAGYPPERAVSQQQSRDRLSAISVSAHKSMQDILRSTDKSITDAVFAHAPFVELIKNESGNKELRRFVLSSFLGA